MKAQVGIGMLVVALIAIGTVIFIFSQIRPSPALPSFTDLTEISIAPEQEAPPVDIPPIIPEVQPGQLIVKTRVNTDVQIRFLTEDWIRDPENPELRILAPKEIRGSRKSQRTDSNGVAVFEMSGLPMGVRVEVMIGSGPDIHFEANLDWQPGALFVVPEKDGRLVIDYEATEFDPVISAGEFHGPDTRKADQRASLKIIK